MFRKTSGFTEIMGHLDSGSFKQFNRAIDSGALLSVLQIKAAFYKVDSPPAPSPVGAQFHNMSLFIWDNINAHINDMKSFYIQSMGRPAFRRWSKLVKQLSKNRKQLLAYSIPLFAENMMNSMSNHPSSAQDVFLSLISPIIDSNANIVDTTTGKKQLQKAPNASIFVPLYAGQFPFTITLFEKSTITNWKNYLEPATCLLLPQVIFEAEKQLSSLEKMMMRTALSEQVNSWRRFLPTIGDIRNWKWLPKLI
jgi:hypothetical protein